MNIASNVTDSPTPGKLYTIEYGDTLYGITSRAYGVSPGQERLDWARVINRAVYNDRFRGEPKNFFPEGLISFYPRFTSSLDDQADASGFAPQGNSFATIWIPRRLGDEPVNPITDDSFVVAAPPEDDELPEPYADSGIPQDSEYWFAYEVKDGDTLHNIAKAMHVSWQFLAELNWGTDDPQLVSWHLENHFSCALPVTNEWQFSSADYPGMLLLPRQKSARVRLRPKRLYVSRYPAAS